MNNHTPAEEFLKGQIGSFEYPYDGASWTMMEKSLRRRSLHKFLKWSGGIAVFTAAVVTVICLTTDKQKCFSIISTNNKISNQQFNNNKQTVDIKPVISQNNITNTYVNTNNQKDNNNSNSTVFIEPVVTNNTQTKDSIKNSIKKDDLLTRTHSKSPCPEFSISDNSGCPPFTTSFTPSEKCDSMIYSWDFGDGKISTEKQPVHTYKKSGKYTVRLMVKYFRSDEMKTMIIENAIVVFPKPKSEIDISVDRNKVNMQTPALDNKLTWIANDTISSGNTADRTYMKNGKYQATLITQNNFGCSDTLTKKFEVEVPLNVFIPNAFTPFNEGPNKVFGPFTDNANIDLYQIEIINPEGKVVFSKKGKNVDWNGLDQQGKPCMQETYHYKLKVWDKFGNFEQYNGNVTLK